jgi:phage gp45-like
VIAQAFARIKLLFAQGVGTLIGDQRVQSRVLDEEVLGNINRVEPYGFSYRPKPGCQTYLVFPGGDRSYGVALIIGDKRFQMDLKEGEVALHDDEENWVHIKRGGIIEAKAATKVIADTPLFETTGDAKIGGDLMVVGLSKLAGGGRITGEFLVNEVDVSEAHTHTCNGDGAQTSGVTDA